MSKTEQRLKLVADARAILDKADSEKRDLTADEQGQVEKMYADEVKLKADIDAEERAKKLKQHFSDASVDLEKSKGRVVPPVAGAKPTDKRATDEYFASFRSYLRFGDRGIRDDEHRSLQADSPTAGGYIVPPTEFNRELIKSVTDQVFVRQLARVFTLTESDSITNPVLSARMSAASWGAEVPSTLTADTAMTFGQRELHPRYMTHYQLVSRKLLGMSAIDTEGLIRDEFARVFSELEEDGFLNGSGANAPLGVFTASALGVSTGRDISTGNTTTTIEADNLFEVYYGLKPQYRSSADWTFHTTAIKQVRQLKDGNGQYLWQPGLQAGQPDSLLGRPVRESRFAPSTFTTGLYVGLFGDFRYYWIADVMGMELQRLEELRALQNQIGFVGRRQTDGAPVLEEAFVRVKLA